MIYGTYKCTNPHNGHRFVVHVYRGLQILAGNPGDWCGHRFGSVASLARYIAEVRGVPASGDIVYAGGAK